MTQPKNMGGLGFQDIELFNLTMLAKQAWRHLQDQTSLSSQILRSVYYPDGNFLGRSGCCTNPSVASYH